jgi:hypothetical protein
MRVISLTSTVFSIFAVLAVFAIGSSEQAYAQFIPSETYFLTGNGFTITENELDGSTIGLTFSPEDTARTAKMIIKEGFLIFQDREYDLANISGSLLRDGKFLRILGTAQDNQGNEISIRIFGRLVGASADGFVYQLTGKIDQGNERFSFHFVTKSALSAEPLSEIIMKEKEIVSETVEQEPVAQEPDIEIQIVADYYKRISHQSVFRFNVNVHEILSSGQPSITSLIDAKISVDIYDSLNNHIRHFEGNTGKLGYSDEFFIGAPVPLGTYKLEISAEYQGATDSKTEEFFVLKRSDGS